MPFGTGPNDPWYYNSFMDIGPFTGSDQSNMSVQQKVQLLRGLPALVYPTQAPPALQNPADDPYRRALAARGPVPTIAQGQQQIIQAQNYPAETGQFQAPQALRDWRDDLLSSIGVPGYKAPPYPSSTPATPGSATSSAAAAPAPVSPTAPVRAISGAPDIVDAPVVYSSPDSGGDTAAVPAASSPDDISDTVKKLQTVLKIMGYPEAPSTSNPKQDAADAYAAHELDRTKLLAQLAFASGLTASAGGGYADIGKGFAAAANVYDQGQARYLKALQGSADRYTEQQKQAYDYQAKKAGTLADLYSLGEKQKLEQAKLARDYAKDRQDIMLRMSAQLLPKPSDSALTTMDPQTEQRRQQQLYRFWNTGNLSFDVSDQ